MVLVYTVRYCESTGWGSVSVSCVVGIFMVRDNRQKVVIVGGDGTVMDGLVDCTKLGGVIICV